MNAHRPFFVSVTAALLACAALLAGCAVPMHPVTTFRAQETFGSVTTYSRMFDASPAKTCEAARRALLSQGYIIDTHTKDLVEGKKHFQPQAESHLQMVIRVVCVPDAPGGGVSLAFVSAVQDSYVLRKTNNSASVGVGGIGSVSLPFAAGSDSLVKVGSETLTADGFYEGFFDLLRRYLIIEDIPE